jgi:hypothetical protein
MTATNLVAPVTIETPNPQTYAHLQALPPGAYLVPENFRTLWDDRNPARAAEQYNKGLKIGREAIAFGGHVSIACNGTWGAAAAGSISSYEGIGYHGETAALLRGFIDSGCTIVVYRHSTGYDQPTTIRKAGA